MFTMSGAFAMPDVTDRPVGHRQRLQQQTIVERGMHRVQRLRGHGMAISRIRKAMLLCET